MPQPRGTGVGQQSKETVSMSWRDARVMTACHCTEKWEAAWLLPLPRALASWTSSSSSPPLAPVELCWRDILGAWPHCKDHHVPSGL